MNGSSESTAGKNVRFPAFREAFARLTNWRMLPPDDLTEDSARRSLFLYPLAGFCIALPASAVTLISVIAFFELQAFVLFSGLIYIFLLAWLSGFSGYRDLCRFSDALAARGATPEEKAEILRRNTAGPAGAAACAMLVAAKVLIVYLLFTRLALFGHFASLFVVLFLAPLAAKAVMIAAALSAPAPDESPASPAGKGNGFFLFLFMILLLCIPLVFFGLTDVFGEFISIVSPAETAEKTSRILQICRADPRLLSLVFSKGYTNMAIFFAAGFLSWLYLNGESKAHLGGMTSATIGAASEIAETAFLTASLLVVELILV